MTGEFDYSGYSDEQLLKLASEAGLKAPPRDYSKMSDADLLAAAKSAGVKVSAPKSALAQWTEAPRQMLQGFKETAIPVQAAAKLGGKAAQQPLADEPQGLQKINRGIGRFAGEALNFLPLSGVAKGVAAAMEGAPAIAKMGAQAATQAAGALGIAGTEKKIQGKELSSQEAILTAGAGALGAVAGEAVPAALKATIGKLQQARTIERGDLVKMAQDAYGLILKPSQVAGTGKAKLAEATIDFLPHGKARAKAIDTHNETQVNRLMNARAGIQGDRVEDDAIANALRDHGAAYGQLVRPERLLSDSVLASDMAAAKKMAATVPGGLPDQAKDLIALLGSKDVRTQITGDNYLNIRKELYDAYKDSVSGASPNRPLGRVYSKMRADLDSWFERSLMAQGKTAELAQIKDLRQKMVGAEILADLNERGHITEGAVDGSKLRQVLEDRQPGWERKTIAERDPMWTLADALHSLEIRPTTIEKRAGEETTQTSTSALLHRSGLIPATAGTAAMGATAYAAPHLASGIGAPLLGAYSMFGPKLWYDMRGQPPSMTPYLAPAMAGAAHAASDRSDK